MHLPIIEGLQSGSLGYFKQYSVRRGELTAEQVAQSPIMLLQADLADGSVGHKSNNNMSVLRGYTSLHRSGDIPFRIVRSFWV
jgi:hypothetical protein